MSKAQPAIKPRRSNDPFSAVVNGDSGLDVGMHQFLPGQRKPAKNSGAGLKKNFSGRSASNHKSETIDNLFSSLIGPKTVSKQPPTSKRKRDLQKKDVNKSFTKSGKENAAKKDSNSNAGLNEDDESDDDLPLADLAPGKSRKRPRQGYSTTKENGKVVSQKLFAKKSTTINSFFQPKTMTQTESQPTIQSRQKQPAPKSATCREEFQVKPKYSGIIHSSANTTEVSMETRAAQHKPTTSTAVAKVSDGNALTLNDIQGHFIKASEMLKEDTNDRLGASNTKTNATPSEAPVTTSLVAADKSTSDIPDSKDPLKRRTNMDVVTPDFDAAKDGITRSNNLAHQLLDRSVLGNRGRMNCHGPRCSQSLQVRPRPLSTKVATWLCLGRDMGNANVTYSIDCMAWDPLGVLLAVAQTCNITKQSWIDIYDWDIVNAADRKGRNDRVRARAKNEKSQLRLNIPPILQFRIPSTGSGATSTKVPWMKWNPHHPDQLAVASRCGSTVFCLDIAQVETSLSGAPSDRIAKPPRHSYWEFRKSSSHLSGTNTSAENASSCLFVAGDHVIIAFGPSLYCWRYYPKRDPTSISPKLKWQHCFPFGGTSLRKASICCLERVGMEHVLLGSSHGHMALIQWKRVVTAVAKSSFSMSSATRGYSPTVLCQWLAHAFLGNQQQIPPETEKEPTIMGIRQLQVEQYLRSNSKEVNKRPKYHEQLCGRFRIQWVTRCGWVLSTVLVGEPSSKANWEEYKVRRERPRILHQTDLVNIRLASGGKVRLPTKEWSLPTEPVAADGSSFFLSWQSVDPVTKILPHHDQRVLDDMPSIIRIPKEDSHLFLSFKDNDVTHSLTLPDHKGRPKCVAVDPSDQGWAVIATSKEQLYIVKLRCNG